MKIIIILVMKLLRKVDNQQKKGIITTGVIEFLIGLF
jgi:hypothetical protein